MTKQILAFLFCFKRELNLYSPITEPWGVNYAGPLLALDLQAQLLKGTRLVPVGSGPRISSPSCKRPPGRASLGTAASSGPIRHAGRLQDSETVMRWFPMPEGLACTGSAALPPRPVHRAPLGRLLTVKIFPFLHG